MTEPEYREIEARLDEALELFQDNRPFFGTDERHLFENLFEVRKEVHELRIEHESPTVA